MLTFIFVYTDTNSSIEVIAKAYEIIRNGKIKCDFSEYKYIILGLIILLL